MTRVLVIMVCHGWGIVSDRLDNMVWYKIAIAGGVYLFTILVSGMNMIGVSSLHNGAAAMLVTVGYFFDTAFYFWIYFTIRHVTFHLSIETDLVKSCRFQWFIRILAMLFTVSCIEGVYQTNWIRENKLYTEWDHTWFIMAGCWDTCYIVTLLIMMWIWRPNSPSSFGCGFTQMVSDAKESIEHAEAELTHAWLSDSQDSSQRDSLEDYSWA